MREWARTAGRLWKNSRNLLCLELLYRTAVFFAVTEAARLFFGAVLEAMGYSYLTAENYAVFISSPATIAGIAVFAAGSLLLLFAELCVIAKSGIRGYEGRRQGPGQIFFDGIRTAFWHICRSPVLCIALAATTGVFACLHFWILEIFQIKILRYALQQIWRPGRMNGVPAAAAAVFAVLSLFFMYALPVLVCGDASRAGAVFRKSVSVFRQHWKTSVLALVLCNAAVTAGIVLIYYVLLAVSAGFVCISRDAHAAMAALFSMNEMVRTVTAFLSGVLGAVCNVWVIAALYVRLQCPERVLEKPLSSGEEKPSSGSAAAVLVLLLAEALLIGQAAAGMPLTRQMYGGTLVTAHRGGAKIAPENTLAALEASIANEADYAEIDVQETKDGELILLHDATFRRTAGDSRPVWEVTLAQAKELDAGGRFSPEYEGEQIPTLEEALKTCRGRLNLNVEVKSNGHNEGIAGKTAACIARLGMEEQCVITSMDYEFLKEVKEENPAIRTGYIMNVAYGRVELLEYADFLSVKSDCVSERFVENIHEAGKEVHVWTVNTRKEMRRMKAAGADNIITDRPGVAREVLSEDKSGAGFLELLRAVL